MESSLEKEICYSTKHRKIGKCVIISNEKFVSPEGIEIHPRRKGAPADVRNLTAAFTRLGLDVESYVNLNSMQMQRVLQNVALEDHSSSDCFVCCISTHGSEGQIAACDGRDVKISSLIYLFEDDQCPSLRGKPKLFFIQACRGLKMDSGVVLKVRQPTTAVDSCGNLTEVLHSQPDLLVACASVKDYASWRNIEHGSWFVQELCNVIEKNETDLLNMMTIVNRLVSYEHKSFDTRSSNSEKKQVPCIFSTLTKKFYFTKKVDNWENAGGNCNDS